MKISKVAVLGAAAALSVGIAGCNSDEKSSSATTSVASTSVAASSPASIDYTSLLIKPSDIDAGWTLKTTKPEQAGITGIFGNSEATEKISTSITVRENSETAAAAVAAAKDAMSQKAGGAAFSPVDVGVGGGVLNAPGGTTVVAFGEGRAFAILEFNSKNGERVPAEVAIEIAKKQDAAIKAGVK
ncbi:hypothetical protein ACFQZZ_00695 [Nocardia sp. GCM10030253]|uniref:hypothetical protein n=1 Tax=Nocardia sp. GCM10030253 TaxID=3273404 RepID=UPI003634ABB0